MPRPRKPDSFSGAERQRRYVKKLGLVTIRVEPEVRIAVREARAATKLTTSRVLITALRLLKEANDKQKRPPKPKGVHIVDGRVVRVEVQG